MDLYYFDLTVNGSSMGPGATDSIPVMARLMRLLHGYFARSPGTFAVAFPELRCGHNRHPGNVIRVFSKCIEAFDGLVDWLENNERIAHYVHRGYPRQVVPSRIKGWVEYRRFQVPKASKPEHWEKSFNFAQTLPFFMVPSSSRNMFFLHIQVVDGTPSEVFAPTTYGLSGAERFAVPVLDVSNGRFQAKRDGIMLPRKRAQF